MARISAYILFFFCLVFSVSGHSQVVDTVPDLLPAVDSIDLLRQQVSALNQRLDSTHVAQATMRHRMRELIALKDSLVYLNDLYQKELQDKNRLMGEQVSAMQEKERLLAEKEERNEGRRKRQHCGW